jgi:hypothetical protein
LTQAAESTVYVYGVLSASDASRVSSAGVDGAPVRTVQVGELAALISDLDAAAIGAAREVRRHWRVLDEATAGGATIVPVRFGTVMAGDDAVCEQLLEAHREHLRALLDHLTGRVELAVKGRYDEERELADIVRSSPAVARLRERIGRISPEAGYYERIKLGEMISAALEQRRAADGDRALARLEPLAVAVQAQPPAGADGAFDLAFLVERERIDDFSAAVTRLGDELGERIELRYVGPMPPFHFADAELAEGSPAWA